MPDRIEELFEELAESANNEDYITFPGGRQIRTQEKLMGDIYSSLAGFGDELTQQGRIGREYEDIEKERLVEGLYKNDPAVLAALGTLATLPVSLPVQAPAWLTRAGIASKVPGLNKSYGAVGGDMVSQTLKAIEQVTGRSGARVNTDVAGRVPLPKIKDPVVTKQGPRGPINIDSPKQMPLPLSGGRNTGGISATERAQLPQTGGGITATKTARGDKEFLDKIMPSVRKDITEEASKTNIKGVRFSRKEWEDMLEETATTGKATKSYMDKVKSLKSLEDKLRIEQAKINAGEAPSKNFTKMLEEAARLRALLKSLE